MGERIMTPETAARVENLLSRMTLEEKIAQTDMIRGVDAVGIQHPGHSCTVDDDAEITNEMLERIFGDDSIGFIHDAYSVPRISNAIQKHAVEKTRLGIPVVFTGEALHGVCRPDATVFPTPLAMAATFDPELVEKVGAAIAAESRCYGITEILAPNLDLGRDARWGRVEETFGEDTYLAAELGSAIVRGEQGDDVDAPDKVAAEPKHYVVHGIPEGGLNSGSARAGRREIETEYLPVFEAAVREAGAYNIMASYNNIDGEAVMASKHYLTEVLRGRFGLRGYVRSDFGGIGRLHSMHKIAESPKDAVRIAVCAGLCVQGFDFPSADWRTWLKELVLEGEVAMETLDEAVRRILRVKFELGLFDRPYTEDELDRKVVRCDEHIEIAAQAARESICLVKNNGLLPLDGNVGSIAVIGPGSDDQYVGGYSPIPYSYKPISVYERMKELYPRARVLQSIGCDYAETESALIPNQWFRNGIYATFYSTQDFSGDVTAEARYDNLRFNWISARPHPGLPFRDYSVVFDGEFTVDLTNFAQADSIEGKLIFNSADTFKLYVDGEPLIDKANGISAPFTFVHGRTHKIRVEFVCDAGGSDVSLSIGFDSDRVGEAVACAEECDVVILVCGESKHTSGEGKDRCTIKIDERQRCLIEAVKRLGKPTALVVQSGRPVDLREEMHSLDAIIVNFFGGDFGGLAAAEAIAGEFSPSGRLPISFPWSIGHVPSHYCRLPGRSSMDYCEMPGRNLLDFGCGLSYTTFEYSDLKVMDKTADGVYDVNVGVNVTNSGSVGSDEVVQLYVNDVYSTVSTPLKRLRGFKRISLAAGESRRVEFRLDFDSFKLCNTEYEWVVEPGEFEIMVGCSSEDIKLTDRIVLP